MPPLKKSDHAQPRPEGRPDVEVRQIGAQLYSGDVSIDFVGRRKHLVPRSRPAILRRRHRSVRVRGLNYGIEFEGGVEFQAHDRQPVVDKVEDVTDAVVGTDIEAAANPVVVASEQRRPSGSRPSR